MKIPEKYSGIFLSMRNNGIKDKQTRKLIRSFREEFFSEPSTLGDLLKVVE